MKSFLFFILILASGYWCYDHYGQNLPVYTTLSHVDGRTMDVIILSRSGGEVTFNRESDGERFTFGIGDLSLLSKCKVYWNFRDSVSAPVSRNSSAGVEGGRSVVGDLHLKGIREELLSLSEKLNLAQYRLDAASTSALERTIEHEMDALGLEIDKLRLKEAEYMSRR